MLETKPRRIDAQEFSKIACQVRDEERSRLARDLHDTTAQHIVAILMQLQSIARREKSLSPASKNALAESKALAKRSLQEIRTLSYALYPPMLDEVGLPTALRIFVEEFSKRSETRINLVMPDRCKGISQDVKIAAFFVVQEGITNARRHSPANDVSVIIRVTQETLKIRVENEVGPQPATRSKVSRVGLGLRLMEERIAHCDGHFQFQIDPTRAVLDVTLPLSPTLCEASPHLFKTMA